jgi:hypothetical protein
MSKLINLFMESDKLDGVKNYKSWSRHMHNTLIYNELWCDIFDGDISPNKPTDATSLAKWNLNDEKSISLLHSFVTEHMFVHIENSKDAWSIWNLLKNIFDTPVASQRVDLQMKLLKQILADNGDVLDYISRINNIHQEIIKGGFFKLEDSFLVSIIINGLPPSYKQFLETLQITNKLSTITFDSLSELLAEHSTSFGKKKNNHEKIFFSLKLKVLKEEENQILEIFRISLLMKAVVEFVVKVEVVEIFIKKISK